MPRGVPAAGFRRRGNWEARVNATAPVTKPALVTPEKEESFTEIHARLVERFAAMDKMAAATVSGHNKSLILSGPPGLGKSYGVMKIADRYAAAGNKVTVVKGFIRPTGLYKVLFENRDSDSVVIFDDADSVFEDSVALNLLKAATDMTRTRTLSWRAETNMETDDGEKLPTSFDFGGKIIFITNYDFDTLINKNNMNSKHFAAMISRSIYLDLGMKTTRDYLVRIQIVAPAMFEMNGVTETLGAEILQFISDNHSKLRELSLRMVLKLITLVEMDRREWKSLARVTCFKSGM
jgi:hypothetical protein